MFSKQRTHKELVQRTEKLLRLLITLEQLTDEDREAIWHTTELNDDEMATEMLKSLQGAAVDMKFADRTYFLDKVSNNGAASLTDRHIDLVKEICSTGRDDAKSDEIAQRGLELLWNIAFTSPKDDAQIDKA